MTGLPTSTGRHGGCRLLLAENGALIVGTGDAAIGTNPRDLTSLGGKTLRLDRRTGKPWHSNPFIKAASKKKRYLLTYGHRNVQGLAQRADGSVWSVEHGPDRDDEVNKLLAGGDYGWNPVPGYNESVPMTDQGLPGEQVGARWRSGVPTLATSGATFVNGKQWRAYNGALAVAALKAERVLFMKFDRTGRLQRVFTPAALRRYGRLRTVTQLPRRSPARGHRRRHGLRSDPGGATARLRRVRYSAPAEEGSAEHQHHEPQRHRPERDGHQTSRVRRPPTTSTRRRAPPTRPSGARPPTRARPARWRA